MDGADLESERELTESSWSLSEPWVDPVDSRLRRGGTVESVSTRTLWINSLNRQITTVTDPNMTIYTEEDDLELSNMQMFETEMVRPDVQIFEAERVRPHMQIFESDRVRPVNIDQPTSSNQEIRLLKWRLMENSRHPSALTNSYKREGQRVVEESFNFIHSETTAPRTPERRNSDSCLANLGVESHLAEHRRFHSDIELSRSLPYRRSPGTVRSDRSPTGRELLEYRDDVGEVYAVYERRMDSQKENGKREKPQVSFDERVEYLERNRRKGFPSLLDQLELEKRQTNLIPRELERRQTTLIPRVVLSNYNRTDSNSGDLYSASEGLDYYLDEDGLPCDDPPSASGYASISHPRKGPTETRFKVGSFSDAPTLDMGSSRRGYVNGSFNNEVMFEVNEEVVPVNNPAVLNRPLPAPPYSTRSGSRKLCIAVLCMMFVLALTGIGIGLTIYFD